MESSLIIRQKRLLEAAETKQRAEEAQKRLDAAREVTNAAKAAQEKQAKVSKRVLREKVQKREYIRKAPLKSANKALRKK